MEFFATLKDTPIPTLLVIGGFIFLFLGIATIKKPIVIDVTPSSRKIALILGVILIGSGLYLLSKPVSEYPTTDTVETPEIVFNVNKEETNGCYVKFNGAYIDESSEGSFTWDWGDGNLTKGFFPQEHTYKESGSYSVTVTVPSGLTKSFIIDVDCQSSPALDSQPITPSETVFSLAGAGTNNFYTIKDGTFIILDNGYLAVAGGYGGGTYINQLLPKNFKVIIKFIIEDPEDQFILGLSNGKEMRPNYHLVLTSTGSSFKQQMGFDVNEGWDKYIKSVGYSIKPDNIYQIEFERKNGGVGILANNASIIGLGSSDVADINQYDYLYLTGAKHRQIKIMSLVIIEAK